MLELFPNHELISYDQLIIKDKEGSEMFCRLSNDGYRRFTAMCLDKYLVNHVHKIFIQPN